MTGRTQLSVDLVARVGGFEAGMRRAASAASGTAARIKDTLGRAGPAIANGLAVGATAGAAALAVGLNRAIESADRLGEASARLGLTTEQFSAFGFAAKFSGIEADRLESAMQAFGVRLEKTEPLLKSLGVATRDVASGAFLPSTEIIKGLSDVFKDLPPGIEESQLAAELFGTRIGSQMIPLLDLGSEGISKMEDRARELGGVLSTESAQAAGEFKDRLDELQIVVNGALVKLIPQATEALNGFADVVTDPNFVQGIGSLIGLLGDTAQGFGLIISQASKAASEVRAFSSEQSDQQLETRLAALQRSISAARSASGGELPANFEITMPNVARDIAERERIIREISRRNRAGLDPAGAPAPTTPEPVKPPRDVLAELRAAQAEADKQRKAEAAARDAASAAAKRQEQAERDLAKAVEEEAKRIEEARRAQIEVEFDLMEAVAMEAAERERSMQAGRDLVADLEFELALMRMTNEERATAIQLRGLDADAITEYGDRIRELNDQLAEQQRQIQFDDDIRRGFEDTFASIIDGSKSAKDALADLASYISSLIAQRLSEQLVDSLFGKPGTSLGSSGNPFGQFVGSLFGGLFGGPRAAGGFVAPGKMYEVAERGPELLTVGNRQFLLPTATGGMVTANPRMGRGGGVVQNISVTGRVDSRTASQLAAEASRAQRRVAARFGA